MAASKTSAKPKVKAPLARVTPEDYAEFIGQIELRDVFVDAVRLEAKTDSRARAPEGEISIVSAEIEWAATPTGFDVRHPFSLAIRDGDTVIAEMDVTFRLRYESIRPMTAAIFQDFHFNVHVNTWPYLRSFVSDMTGRMGWQPLTLPVLKVGAVTRSHEGDEHLTDEPTPPGGKKAARLRS